MKSVSKLKKQSVSDSTEPYDINRVLAEASAFRKRRKLLAQKEAEYREVDDLVDDAYQHYQFLKGFGDILHSDFIHMIHIQRLTFESYKKEVALTFKTDDHARLIDGFQENIEKLLMHVGLNREFIQKKRDEQEEYLYEVEQVAEVVA
jgi:hypothetical protein